MRPNLTFLTSMAVIAAMSAVANAQSGSCDRQCLVQILDRYLDRMLAHDPGGIPMAANANIRELTVPVKLGEGASWTKISKLRTKQVFADPIQGGVEYRGAVETGGTISSLSVRLKVEKRRITEVETVLNEGDRPFDAEYLLEPDPLLESILPAERRSTREEMLRIANDYFEAIGTHNPGVAKFAKRCERFESGWKITHNKVAANGSVEGSNESCPESLAGLRGQQTVNRRFPIVDMERGVVLGMTFIQHQEAKPPYALYMHELFKIVDGKIWSIDNIAHRVAWPPNSGFGQTLTTPYTPSGK
jgi:hypothetical protein